MRFALIGLGSLAAFALFAGAGLAVLDTTAPHTTASYSPVGGWASHAVLVNLHATDPDSAVSSITYSASGAQTIGSTVVSGATASFTITQEGVTTISFWAVDPSANTESTKTATVRIDKTVPTIGSAVSAAANANGWNNS